MPLSKTKKPAKGKRIKPEAGDKEKTGIGTGGRGPKLAPQPPSAVKAQYAAFERGIQLLHQKRYGEAKDMFEKARLGPVLEVTSRATSHVHICERRLAEPPEPKSAEEHYNYAVALINLRKLEQARRHLEIALHADPRADHVHYAMGICLGLSGDTHGAYDSLKRAIELQPRNRMVARQDSDLDGICNQPQFNRLLYPDRQ